MHVDIDVGEFDRKDRLPFDLASMDGILTGPITVNLLLERHDVEELVTRLRRALRKQDPDESYWDDTK
jgi:hypothetical protein